MRVSTALVRIRPFADALGPFRKAAVVAGLALVAVGCLKMRIPGQARPEAELSEVPPVLPLIIDLEDPDSTLDTLSFDIPHHSALCLIRRGGDPITKLLIDLSHEGPHKPELIRRGLSAAMLPLTGDAIQTTGTSDKTRGLEVPATVVIATRNRPAQLVECLDSILEGTAIAQRIIVVDNAPSDNRTAELVAARAELDPRLVYVREERPGLAHAHNAALPIISTQIVAFTDDDVLVDRRWLERIARVFSEDEKVACVTGMIAPRELLTLPQQWVEGNMTYDKGLFRRIFDGTRNNAEFPLMPYTSGACGSGANMAFRTGYLQRTGGFEAALGTGTVAMGGDDLAAFYDVLASGNRLVYEPAAIVLHTHHRDYSALRRQVYGYGAGLGAHLMRCLIRDPRMVLAFAKNAAALRSRAITIMNPPVVEGLPPYPKDLLRQHRRGLLSGPWRYLRSRHHLKNQAVPGGT